MARYKNISSYKKKIPIYAKIKSNASSFKYGKHILPHVQHLPQSRCDR